MVCDRRSIISHDNIFWFVLTGALLLSMGLVDSLFERWPVSSAMLYLPVGYAIGPGGFNLIDVSPGEHAGLMVTVVEIALLLSLFTVGLKLRVPLTHRIWRLPLRLGGPAMILTVGMLALFCVVALGMPTPVAVLIGAILAPTDPVLASDVQIHQLGDHDQIRTGLTGEGGLNDGTAFPMMMIALALLGVPQAQSYADSGLWWRIVWGIASALVVGGGIGVLVSRGVAFLRRRLRIALGMEEFLAIGLIALTFGLTELIHGIGFLAVFAAGVGMRGNEARSSGETPPEDLLGDVPVSHVQELATDPKKGPAYMAATVMDFNQQLENFAELLMVTLIGILISKTGLSWEGVAVAATLFFVVRPIAVVLSLSGAHVSRTQWELTAWFGIRGIGSLYYLLFSLQYHWPAILPASAHDWPQRVSTIVLTVVAMSIIVHGVSAKPLMAYYYRHRGNDKKLP